MSERQKIYSAEKSIFHPLILLMMVLCLVLNILLSAVARMTDLPFYFDTIGTFVAAALGGIVPGILVSFFTSAINFLMDGESIFYAPLNILIALFSAVYFSEFSQFKKNRIRKKNPGKSGRKKEFMDLLLFILLLAFIGGGVGAWVTWFLYGKTSGSAMLLSISRWFSRHLSIGDLGCHMIATFIVDVIDKAISVLLSLVIIITIPPKIKNSVKVSLWRQKPLTMEELESAPRRIGVRMSLGFRINMVIILSTFLMMVVALVFSSVSFRDNTMDSLSSTASQIAYLASQEIDPAKVDSYLEGGYSAPGYIETKDRLSIIKNSSSDIAFLYVYRIEEDGCHVIFDLDAVLSDGSFIKGDSPGYVVPFDETYEPYLDDLLAGNQMPTIRVKDQYGSFIASYFPVYDSNGNCLCYAISNIEAKVIGELQRHFFGRVVLLFAGFFILIVIISVLTTRYRIVMPIVSMTIYANEMTDKKGGANEESLEKLEELDIRTGDEMEQLYRAFCKLTGDTVYQLNDNKVKSEAIAKMQNALLITMADMVESRDSDTGAHVLKTAAYVRIILQGLKRNGYYAEKITDKYMRDVEMSAPLHDVGKINIPDAILNKPGKLTAEEFEIMKTHTTAGQKILDNAISSMEGDNYLKEARNMAAYHHERWDGGGYPEGLHGEVIPLSARIMAIADVFDALSSPRVYKPAYPFDEAVSMIKEGAGTQFDPKCVEVFLESIAEVKKVHKKYQET